MALSAAFPRYHRSPSSGSVRRLALSGRVIRVPAFTRRSMIFCSMRLTVFCWSRIWSTSLFPNSCPYTLTLRCRMMGYRSGR